jgi:hypothetical protein
MKTKVIQKIRLSKNAAIRNENSGSVVECQRPEPSSFVSFSRRNINVAHVFVVADSEMLEAGEVVVSEREPAPDR